MDEAILDHRRKLSREINNLKSSNSQEFWKLLKKGKTREQPNIPIDKLFEFFKTLNENPDADPINIPLLDPGNVNELNENINMKISKEEILKCIKKLKNNKACGEDLVINEYIKSTTNTFIDIYEQLFNIIFETGIVPDNWLMGNIKPIYKNKGDKMDPKNYRPITILSCLGKLFTAVLSERLTKYSDDFFILNENQCGFRKGYSTLDNLFVLFNFFEILKNKKNKMFCAFIDFEKAFDKVWRDGLWYKLLLNNMNGNMYNIIVNMYSGTKSCISYNDCKSEFFPCNNGVRQAENLSPFLFAVFMNDLESYLTNCNLNGLQTISNEIETQLGIYLKLFVILYADDTVLMAESSADLQNQLNSFQDYCSIWKLKVNTDKSKVMVFSRGKLPRNLNFSLNGEKLEIVNSLNYLGIELSRTGNFKRAKQSIAGKATVAFYEVLKMGRKHGLSVKIQLDLFDKMVKPILLYGCEVWGFSNNDIIEKVHLKFCKLLLHLKSSTPSYMIYGELGRYPLEIYIKSRIISFWAKLLSGKELKLSKIMYNLCYCMSIKNVEHFTWLDNVKKILNECGFAYIWNTQTFVDPNWLRLTIIRNLQDQFEQYWHSLLDNASKAINYRLFKDYFGMEVYFDILDNKNVVELCRFRTANHKLPIEIGRWNNTNRNNRMCTHCNKNELGDEFHYILDCPFFEQHRNIYIPKYYYSRPNVLKYKLLLSSKKKSELIKLSKFINHINKTVCTPA